MLVPSIDPTPYVRPPRTGIAGGLSLSKMLLTRVPTKPGPGVIMMAKALAATVVATEADWRVQLRAKFGGVAKVADLRLDRDWAVVRRRLVDHEDLPAGDPDRLRSAELVERLFPDGLRFLKLRYVEEHAESNLRLEIIEDEGLRADLDHLVGKRFMIELVAAHEHYGAVLGITEVPEDETSKISMLERLRELTQAISDYALQVLAFSRMHPDNLAPAEQALAPIDAFRQAARRAASKGAKAGDGAVSVEEEYELPEGAPAPDSPVPVVAEE